MPQVTVGVEVIVVDNGSDELPEGLSQEFPGVRILMEERKGAAHARNRGVAETVARYLFFLDSDCVPASDWLETALAVADRADVIGGRVEVFDETPPPRTGAQSFETVFAFDNRGYVEKKDFSVTANLITRRDVFLATGPFHAGLSEDLDWCRRAKARGYQLAYVDALWVSHPTRSDWPSLRRKWRRMTDEGFGVSGRGPSARLRWALRALAMPVSAIVHAPRVLLHPELRDTGERLRGLGTLLRLRLLRAVWMLRQAIRGV